MNGFKRRLLLTAAAVLFSPAAASAQDQGHQLSGLIHFSLTILPQAVVSAQSNARGFAQIRVTGNGGVPLRGEVVSYVVGDSHGERTVADERAVDDAIAECQRAGAREVDVSLNF